MPGKAATGVPVSKTLVWLYTEKDPQQKQELNPICRSRDKRLSTRPRMWWNKQQQAMNTQGDNCPQAAGSSWRPAFHHPLPASVPAHGLRFVCLFVGCLSSQQHASVSQGRICSDNFTCCHTEIEAADQTFHLTQSQYTDTGPTSPSADPITPGAWQGSHWSANF